MGWKSGGWGAAFPRTSRGFTHNALPPPACPPLPHTTGLCPQATTLGLTMRDPSGPLDSTSGLELIGPRLPAGAPATGRDRLLACSGLSCRAERARE